MSQAPLEILVVDDDPHMAKHVATIARLTLRGVRVHVATRGTEALAHVRGTLDPAARIVVVSDLNLGEGPSGVDVLREARERHPHARLVLMSGEHPAVVADALAGAQVHAFLEKPFRLEEMQSALASASS